MMWLYYPNSDNTARFTLGEYQNFSDKTLICVGINPSTAEPDKLDRTLKKVKKISIYNKYTNWVMLNVYPQRATNPNKMHQNLDEQLHQDNLNAIAKVLADFNNADILFAYGNLINKRGYLNNCLLDILNSIQKIQFNGQFYCIKRTKKGNPVHPLYQKVKSTLIPYLRLF